MSTFTFRDEAHRKSYEYCRDVMFPVLKRANEEALANMAKAGVKNISQSVKSSTVKRNSQEGTL